MTRRVLAIRPRALGDVVLVTPALRALANIPEAALDVVTERRYAPLLEPLPGIRRVWRSGRTARDAVALARVLRRQRYDVVVDFFGNPRTALLTRASGAALRAGYDLRGRRAAYNLRVPRSVAPPRGEREHAAAVHLRLARAVGGIEDGLGARIAVTAEARAAAERALARCGVVAPKRTVGLVASPCASAYGRRPRRRRVNRG